MKRTLLICVLSLSAFSAFSAVNDRDAVRAIVGEAAGEGKRGMLAVACAIRNRGTLRGVYGLRSPMPDHQPEWVWARARAAWKESSRHDITLGATHWGNDADLAAAFYRKLTPTVIIGHHHFFK